jgi:UDP-3-O-[3-hydroxymyristoyl] glucosamine N-acyltransferase
MTGSAISYSLRELVERFGGEIVGDPEARVSRVATLENAGPETIAFLANPRYLRQLATTQAPAVIVAPAQRDLLQTSGIVHEQPYLYFARVSTLLSSPRRAEPGIHASAAVHPEACIDAGAEIGAYAVVARGAQVGRGSVIGAGTTLGENARVGRECHLHAQVAVYEGCTLGDRVIVHSGVVIGADGFGIAFDADRWIKVPQVGRVRIGDDVEIGANTTIDRGAIDDTVVEHGVKLDNQIQVGHNVTIGAHTAIAGCVGISGSTTIGRRCMIGGGVGIAGHLRIADDVVVTGCSLVSASIKHPGSYSSGMPAVETRMWRRMVAHLRRLDRKER